MYNIVYITDDNYVLPTKTSINSIVRNCADTELAVHVIAVEVSEENQRALRNLASKKVAVKVLNFSNEFSDVGLNHLYVSKAALFKFQLPNIFPDVDSILYVDGDMILFPDFLEIFDFDISGKYAAVVQDMLACFMGFDKKIGHEKYFNSGMMYLNLEKMRRDGITGLLIEYKKKDTDKSFMDQNALNAILGKNCLWISPKFNMMATCSPEAININYEDDRPFLHMADFYGITEDEMRSAWQNPAILHVTSETKAWKNIQAARIDEWIPYASQDDALKVAKNYCASLEKELSDRFQSGISSLSDCFSEEISRFSKSLSGIPWAPYVLGTNMLSAASDGVSPGGFYPREDWGCWTEGGCSVHIYGNFPSHTGDLFLAFRCHAFHEERQVDVVLGGMAIHSFRLGTESQELRIKIPAEILRQDMLLEFRCDKDGISPKELGLGGDDRKLCLAFGYIRIEEDFSSLRERCSEQARKIETLQAQLNETHALLINTRHRTLYGACAWLFRKVFKKR